MLSSFGVLEKPSLMRYKVDTEHDSVYTEQCSGCKGRTLRRKKMVKSARKKGSPQVESRLVRADAQRNLESILQAALAVFEDSGVDAPVRQIAEKAGVGIATLYRHFPERSDLIKAVVRQEVDACAEAASLIASENEPGEALASWMQRLVDLIKTKRGLAAALHSGSPTYQSLPDYFLTRLTPALKNLLDAAKTAGAIRADVEASELLLAAARLATPASEGDVAQARRMVALLVAGLRCGVGIGLKARA